MSYPVQNSPAPKNYQPVDNGNEADFYDTYGGIDETDTGQGFDTQDSYTGQQGEAGPSSVKDFRSRIQELETTLQSSELKDKQKDKIKGQLEALLKEVNYAQSLSPKNRDAKLQELAGKLSQFEGAIMGIHDGQLDMSSLPDGGAESIKEELGDYRKEVEGMKNLTSEEKTDALAKIDKWLTEIKLSEGGGKKTDLSEISSGLETLQEELKTTNEYSPGVKGLAEKSDLEPEKIKAKAKAKGIDLDKLPDPPTKEIIDFICELVPDLKEKLKKVQTAVDERKKSIEDTLKAANAQTASNHGDTSSGENHDMSSWQKLFDLKYFQDDKSKAVKDAMQDVSKDMVEIFQALYPEKKIQSLESSGLAGWQKTEDEYKKAGVLQFGDVQLDLFNNKDGQISCSTAPEDLKEFADYSERWNPGDKIKIPEFWWDGEGDGAWNAPATAVGVNSYGEDMRSYLVSDDFGNDF